MLQSNTTYVLIRTSPPAVPLGGVATLTLCEPGGPEFDIQVRITNLEGNDTFRGVVESGDPRDTQRVRGTLKSDKTVHVQTA
jgi:hypothetical protein